MCTGTTFSWFCSEKRWKAVVYYEIARRGDIAKRIANHRPARPTCAGQAGQWRVKIILQVKSSNHKVPPSHSAAEVACRRLNLGRVVSLSEASLLCLFESIPWLRKGGKVGGGSPELTNDCTGGNVNETSLLRQRALHIHIAWVKSLTRSASNDE